MTYWDAETTPKPDRHGDFPYPADSSGDVHPGQPTNVGESPYPIDSSGDVHPQADRHDGEMNLNLGKTRPHL